MKILIISHNSLSNSSNNGKTLNSLFSSFDVSQTCQLYFHDGDKPESSVCNSFFKLTHRDVLKSILCKNKSILRTESTTSNKSPKLLLKFKSRLMVSNKSRFYPLMIILRDLIWKMGTWKSIKLSNWITNMKPDLIFYVAGNSEFSHLVTRSLSESFNIPYVIYFTDDYLINPLKRNLFDQLVHYHLKNIFEKSIQTASMCFAIGDLMCYEYTSYFKRNFFPLMNGLDSSKIPLIKNNKRIERNSEVKIVYFGGMHLGRDKMIVRFSKILNELRKNYQITFNVYSTAKLSSKLLSKFEKHQISFLGKVTEGELVKVANNSTAFLHVESDNKYYRSLTKLSISTKIPEYLFFKRPIIAFGPNEVASMDILSKNDMGIVLSSKINEKMLISELDNFFDDYNLQKTIVENGYKFALKNFEQRNVSSKLKEKLEKLINNTSCNSALR